MHSKLHEQVQLSCNLKCTFQCTFLQILKCTFRCNSRCITRCTQNCTIKLTSNTFIVARFALSWASPGALKCTSPGANHCAFISPLHSFFNCPDFASICALKSIFDSFLKCDPYNLSFTFGVAVCDFLVQSKQIIDCIFKCTMIYTNSCIIYSAGTALFACVKQRLTTF